MNRNRNTIGCLALTLVLLLTGFGARSQEPGMAELRTAVGELKALKTYRYETETTAVFPGGKKDRMTTKVYMDAPGKRLGYQTDYELLVLTPQWVFKADHKRKIASVLNVPKYDRQHKKELGEIEKLFKSNLTATFLDSVVLRNGKLASAKKSGDLMTFVLRFPDDFSIEEVVMVYNSATRLPESVKIRTFYPGDLSGSPEKGTVIETFSTGYSVTVPAKVFDTGQYFRIQNGKPVLLRYKDYKVTTNL